MYQVLIGLGSNLQDPVAQIKRAMNTLSAHSHITLIKHSSLYSSLPQGPQDQNTFINAVICISTTLAPQQLLQVLQSIEQDHGRIKTRHWGERCIDLDILFIDQLTLHLKTPDLVVPHPHALTRDFVLIPALEIMPLWKLPNGELLASALHNCLQHDLKKIDDTASDLTAQA